MKPLERILELRKEIIEHDKRYSQNAPTISDSAYDELYLELADLEKKFPEYQDSESPTSKIYNVFVDGLTKVEHPQPMLSQEKITTAEGIEKFLAKAPGESVLIEEKCDGLSLGIIYKNGVFHQAVSRGNGLIGSDISHTARVIKSGMPLRIPFKGELHVRGEALIDIAEFERINVDGKYSNPRNLVSGTIMQYEAKVAKERNLKLRAFDAMFIEGMTFESHEEAREFLKTQGFAVTDGKKFPNKTPEDRAAIIRYCAEFSEKQRSKIPHMIDGLIISYNDLSVRKKMGYTAKHPKFSAGYKFKSLDETSILREVVWQIGKLGQVSPVAVFDNVEIDNVNITRATLHNMDYIRTKDIRIGDRVIISRMNDVIPGVTKSLSEERTGSEIQIEAPSVCPDCGGEIIDKGANLYCTNPKCRSQALGRLTHFVSRDALNVDGTSVKTMELLYDESIVTEVSDLYSLEDHSVRIAAFDGMGLKKVTKLLEGLEASKEAPLSRVLYALAIPNIGRTVSKVLAKEYGSMDAVLEVCSKENAVGLISSLNEIGPVIAESLVDYMGSSRGAAVIESLKAAGLTMIEEIQSSEVSEKISGKTFVVTGKLAHYDNRDALKAEIEGLGGKVAGSVSSKTDFLINNDIQSTSGKNKKAKSLNVPIITEDEYIAMKS